MGIHMQIFSALPTPVRVSPAEEAFLRSPLLLSGPYFCTARERGGRETINDSCARVCQSAETDFVEDNK